jgi:hypothetical protein
MNAFLTSAKTTVLGFVTVLCGGAHLAGVIPDNWMEVVNGACGILIGLGLIAAKDANVSNATNAAVAHKVD